MWSMPQARTGPGPWHGEVHGALVLASTDLEGMAGGRKEPSVRCTSAVARGRLDEARGFLPPVVFTDLLPAGHLKG